MHIPIRSLVLSTFIMIIHTELNASDIRPLPLIVAHRGLLQYAPENTLSNFRACLELRLGFEFDVERTKDGHLICFHDSTLNRTTNGQGRVADATLEEIRLLDAGHWFDPKFAGEKVPTVEDIMKLISEYPHHDFLVAVDLKTENVGPEVVRLAEKYDVLSKLIFIGKTIVDPKVRDQIKGTSNKAFTAAVANNIAEFDQALAATNADWVYLRFIASKDQIAAIHQAGKWSFIAGVAVEGNNPENWMQCTQVGIDAILTDYPFELDASQRRLNKKK